ncbi:PPC domain-containing DNA-binding protein [Bifidobacterium samirii]|uniref:PPC domain-containing protein n=1 Tax=Bifidobacterium samirii TaxID=2306974 RepID=A0A430FUQ1_9BIFI|nr:PPC domain-containing DNA-binding protein [Bifidobacterium samirii]RSX57194.1 hypothetical protein D2E24_0787 [Bifidobacterium samirii]
MEYSTIDGTHYLRVAKGESVPQAIIELCRREHVGAAQITGIGACSEATISTWIAERADFTDHTVNGTLEMVALTGNITRNAEGEPHLHAHAVFSYLDAAGRPALIAGHVKDITIGYTGEIVIRPAGETIGRKWDDAAGIDVWDLPHSTTVDLR